MPLHPYIVRLTAERIMFAIQVSQVLCVLLWEPYSYLPIAAALN